MIGPFPMEGKRPGKTSESSHRPSIRKAGRFSEDANNRRATRKRHTGMFNGSEGMRKIQTAIHANPPQRQSACFQSVLSKSLPFSASNYPCRAKFVTDPDGSAQEIERECPFQTKGYPFRLILC
jgi:hypothetical protein